MSNLRPAYRAVLRAINVAFKGDVRVATGARAELRKQVVEGTPSEEAAAHMAEVARFLRQNVVQGVPNERGVYELQIHDETERGLNETIRTKKSEMGSLAGVKGRTTKCT